MRWRERTSYLVEERKENRLIGSVVARNHQILMIAGDERF
jgi:hypothetical protein